MIYIYLNICVNYFFIVIVIFLKNIFENIYYKFDENEGINVNGFFLRGGGGGGLEFFDNFIV